jgi:hypothetical protein
VVEGSEEAYEVSLDDRVLKVLLKCAQERSCPRVPMPIPERLVMLDLQLKVLPTLQVELW